MIHRETIALTIAEKCGVTWDDIVSREKTRFIFQARRHVAGILYDVLGLSYPEIARLMSRVNHSTAYSLAIQYRKLPKEHREAFENSIPELKAWKQTHALIHPTTKPVRNVEYPSRPDSPDLGGGSGVLPQEPRRPDQRPAGKDDRGKRVGKVASRARRRPVWESTGSWNK